MSTVAPASIPVDDETMAEVTRLRDAGGVSYDEVIRRLLRLIPEGDDEGLYSDAFRMDLLDAKLDMQEGRLVDQDEVRQRLGLA